MGYLGTLLLSVFVVLVAARIGAFALEITGMESEAAKFQALSAFTGTGFTTSEAERVVRNRSRRRIISILILVGAAGLVTIVGTMAATFVDATGYSGFFIRLGIMVVVIVILYRVIMVGRVGNWVAHWFRRPLMKLVLRDAPAVEEVFSAGREVGVYLVMMREESKSAGSPVGALEEEGDLQILAMERGQGFIDRPDAGERVLAGDRLLVYATGKSLKRLSA